MIYLASQSPRRRELLEQIGIQFTTCHVDVIEERSSTEIAQDYVLRLAADKAQAGIDKLHLTNKLAADDLVLGADTIVVYQEQVLEKPRDKADAQRMMRLLSGNQHQVMTAIAVASQQTYRSEIIITDVKFRSISEQEMSDYWDTGEPEDKAGGYAIQGLAGRFVEFISGNYSAVVGLPLMQTEQLLQSFKVIPIAEKQ